MSLKRYLDERQAKPKILDVKQRDIIDEEITQYTDLEFSFELNGTNLPRIHFSIESCTKRRRRKANVLSIWPFSRNLNEDI